MTIGFISLITSIGHVIAAPDSDEIMKTNLFQRTFKRMLSTSLKVQQLKTS